MLVCFCRPSLCRVKGSINFHSSTFASAVPHSHSVLEIFDILNSSSSTRLPLVILVLHLLPLMMLAVLVVGPPVGRRCGGASVGRRRWGVPPVGVLLVEVPLVGVPPCGGTWWGSLPGGGPSSASSYYPHWEELHYEYHYCFPLNPPLRACGDPIVSTPVLMLTSNTPLKILKVTMVI